jgi:hypothetical protein
MLHISLDRGVPEARTSSYIIISTKEMTARAWVRIVAFRMAMIPFEACQTRGKDGRGDAAMEFGMDITDITFPTRDSPGKGQQGATVARR